jgi:hypothetical protein
MKANVTPFALEDQEMRDLISPEMDRWLNSWSVEEQAKYAGHYVAVNRERQVVAADRSASRLQRTLKRLGTPKVRVFLMESPDVHIVYSLRS